MLKMTKIYVIPIDKDHSISIAKNKEKSKERLPLRKQRLLCR